MPGGIDVVAACQVTWLRQRHLAEHPYFMVRVLFSLGCSENFTVGRAKATSSTSRRLFHPSACLTPPKGPFDAQSLGVVDSATRGTEAQGHHQESAGGLTMFSQSCAFTRGLTTYRVYKVYVIESLGEKVARVWALWAGGGGLRIMVAVRHFAIIHGKDFLSCLSFVISTYKCCWS